MKHINPKYKFESYKEIMAPYEAVFYLAEAYHKSDELEIAKKKYKEFYNHINEDEYDKELVIKRIASCQYAMEWMEKPVEFDFKNIGNSLNTNFEEANVVISGDGKTIAFTRKLQFYDAIMISYKTDSGWTAPLNLIPYLGVDGGITTSSLNYTGNTLYIYNVDGYDGNIYASYKNNDIWGKLVKLNNNINTKYWESNASESANGKILYFASNRPEGYGKLDLYMSYRTGAKEWGPAINLGPIVNSEYNDDAPVILQDGKILIFSSNGHQSIGDYDFFYSKSDNNGIWSKPQNVGYPINTTKQEILFSATEDANTGYFTLFKEDSYGLKDIYKAKLNLPFLNDKTTKDVDIDSTLNNKKERETFTVSLNETEKKNNRNDSLTNASSTPLKDSNNVLSVLAKHSSDKDAIAQNTLQIHNKKLNAAIGEKVKVPIHLKSPSLILVSTYNNGVKIAEKTIDCKTTDYIYVTYPKKGNNTIVFSLLDQNGNVTEKNSVDIICLPQNDDSSNILTQQTSKRNVQTYSSNQILSLFQSNVSNSLLTEALSQIKNEKTITLIELIRQLYTNTLKQNSDSSYSISDVNQMVLQSLELDRLNINDFYNILLQHSTIPLRDYITGLPLNQEGYTPIILLNKIFDDETYNSYTTEDIYITLSKILESWIENDHSFKKIAKENKTHKLIWPYITGIATVLLIIIWFIKRKKKEQNKNKN